MVPYSHRKHLLTLPMGKWIMNSYQINLPIQMSQSPNRGQWGTLLNKSIKEVVNHNWIICSSHPNNTNLAATGTWWNRRNLPCQTEEHTLSSTGKKINKLGCKTRITFTNGFWSIDVNKNSMFWTQALHSLLAKNGGTEVQPQLPSLPSLSTVCVKPGGQGTSHWLK